jgi:hypothetical protein
MNKMVWGTGTLREFWGASLREPYAQATSYKTVLMMNTVYIANLEGATQH